MTAIKYDIDYVNIPVSTNILLDFPTWQLCSDKDNSGPAIKDKTPLTCSGFSTSVWLASNGYYLLIMRQDYIRMLRALGRMSVHVSPTEFEPNGGPPPNFCKISARVSGQKLKKACDVARIDVVRLVSLNLKHEIAEFISMFEKHAVDNGDYCVDIAAVQRRFDPIVDKAEERVEPAEGETIAGIPLVFKKRDGNRGRIWNILGELGCAEAGEIARPAPASGQVPCGTMVSTRTFTGADGKSKCKAVCCYAGGIVHYFKLAGVYAEFEDMNTNGALKQARNRLCEKIRNTLVNNAMAIRLAHDELRIECRFEIEGSKAEAMQMLVRNRVGTIEDVSAALGAEFGVVRVPLKDYFVQLRFVNEVLNDPELRVAVGKDQNAPTPMSLARYAQAKRLIGLFGRGRSISFADKYAIWYGRANLASKDDIVNMRYFWQPQDPNEPDQFTALQIAVPNNNNNNAAEREAQDAEDNEDYETVDEIDKRRQEAAARRDFDAVYRARGRRQNAVDRDEAKAEMMRKLKFGGAKGGKMAVRDKMGHVVAGGETKEEIVMKVWSKYGKEWKSKFKV